MDQLNKSLSPVSGLFFTTSFVLHLSSFLKLFKDILHTKIPADSSLEMTLMKQQYYYVLIQLCYLWHFS